MKTPFARSWDALDPDEMRDEQLRRLRAYIGNLVLPFSAYYRDRWTREGIDWREIETWDDWAHLPFTSKRDLLSDAEHPQRSREFVLIPDEAALRRRPSMVATALIRGTEAARDAASREFRPILMTSTTGRSADSVPFAYTAYDLNRLELAGKRVMEIGGSHREWKHLNVFPYAPHLGFWQVHAAGIGFGAFCLSTGGGKVMGTAGNVAMLAKVQPEIVVGMPTFVYHLLQEAVEAGAHNPGLRKLVLGGEKVPDGMRRKLRALAAELGAGKVDVQVTYAFTEAKMAWMECPPPPGVSGTGYHLYPDMGLVEVVDPETGRPVGEKQPGEIVFTPIDARGTVVLRYRTGDCTDEGITHEPCPHCGRSVPRILGRISRVSDIRRLRIDKVKGTLVNFNELEHILDDLQGIGSWQIELRKRNDDPLEMDELVVHVHRAGREKRDTLERQIEERFLLSAEIRPNRIEFHDSATLQKLQGVGQSLKEERLVDHRPGQAAKPPAPTRESHEEYAE